MQMRCRKGGAVCGMQMRREGRSSYANTSGGGRGLYANEPRWPRWLRRSQEGVTGTPPPKIPPGDPPNMGTPPLFGVTHLGTPALGDLPTWGRGNPHVGTPRWNPPSWAHLSQVRGAATPPPHNHPRATAHPHPTPPAQPRGSPGGSPGGPVTVFSLQPCGAQGRAGGAAGAPLARPLPLPPPEPKAPSGPPGGAPAAPRKCPPAPQCAPHPRTPPTAPPPRHPLRPQPGPGRGGRGGRGGPGAGGRWGAPARC